MDKETTLQDWINYIAKEVCSKCKYYNKTMGVCGGEILPIESKRTQYGNRRDKPGMKRMVGCIGDDEAYYSSCAEVERLFGLPKGSVSRVCRGEIDSIDGYRFYYL